MRVQIKDHSINMGNLFILFYFLGNKNILPSPINVNSALFGIGLEPKLF